MEFKKEFLIDILEYDDYENRKLEGTSRWSNDYSVVFEHEGKYYRTYYSEGATEMQDESPFQYDDDIIECEEVELKEIIVKKWVTKNS